jgi:Ca2+-binding RTX toxin-like protein
MAFFFGNNLNNIANATGAGTLIGFLGGNIALLQDAIGDNFQALGGNDSITAGNGNDIIFGGDGNDFIDGRFGFDRMDGGAGVDTMDVSFFGGNYVWNMTTGITNFSAGGEFAFNFENARTGAGNDVITGTSGNNIISTNGGNDLVNAGDGSDLVSGGNGNDNLSGGNGNDSLAGDDGSDVLNGGAGSDRVNGGNGNDLMLGGDGNDFMNGGAGVDNMNGGNGNDELAGGASGDVMNGGAGFDDFNYSAVSDSALGASDVINGFQNVPIFAGAIDQIDLSAIDANPFVAGDQAFIWRENLPFNGVGQVRWFNAGGNTIVDVNTDLDAVPEMRVVLTGVYNLDPVDFIL